MSDADLLRRAAALMRERAEAVPAGPWFETERLSDVLGAVSVTPRLDAEHIASWHPAAGLAAADLLDQHARVQEFAAERGYELNAERATIAVTFARAYLGSES